MKERLFESLGRGVPVEFASAWNREQSLIRLKKLLVPHHFCGNNDALVGYVEDSGIVLQAPFEEFRRASGDRFAGWLQDDEKGVRLVGEFRVSAYNTLITILFISGMLLFSLISIAFGLIGLVNRTLTMLDALGIIFLLPLPAIAIGLLLMWWQSLSKKEVALISDEIRLALSNG